MSAELTPHLEIDDWAESELSEEERDELLARAIATINCMAVSANFDFEKVDYYKASADIGEEGGQPKTHLGLEAFAQHHITSWEFAPMPPWIAKLHLDERVLALSGYPKPAAMYRRTYVSINPFIPEPIRIVRSHELKRRSQHKYSRAGNVTERNLLRRQARYNRTALVQADRLLIDGMIWALDNRTDIIRERTGEGRYYSGD